MRVREVIRMLEVDGWRQVASKGSHLQFKHPTKPGRVTVAVHGGDVAKWVLNSIKRQAGLK